MNPSISCVLSFGFSHRRLQRCVMTLKPNPQQMFVFQQMWKTSLFNLNGFLNKFRHTLTTLHLPRHGAQNAAKRETTHVFDQHLHL